MKDSGSSTSKFDDLNSELKLLREQLKQKDENIKNLESILDAYSKTDAMAKQEMLDVEKRLKDHEQISHFSVKELELRDIALRNVLEVNKNISSILEENKLLEKILEGLLVSLKAQRGILFILKDDFLIAKIFKNINHDEMQKAYFDYCLKKIDSAVKSRETMFRLYEPIELDGEESTISFVCLPLIYDNRPLGLIYLDMVSDIKTFRVQDLDIAEIFSSQAAISMNNAALYQKIRNQNLELMKLVNIKSQLIDEVSKKIKRPIMQVHGLIDKILKDNKTDSICQEAMNHLDRVFDIVGKVQTTVNKVVTIQDLEKEVNDLFSERVDFEDLFRFIISFYEEEIEHRHLTIDIDLSSDFERYHGNKTIMRTIFDELISNAILYNKPNGTVRIHGYKRGDYLIIDIIDTGFGIKKEDMNAIFQQFYRTVDSPNMNDKGAGLGLYLVKKFIKYYNGDISVKSKHGEGSTFTVKLLMN